MNIIPYEDRYRDAVRAICLMTASERYRKDGNTLFTLYADYYLDNEKNNCFIALSDNGEVVGYVLSAISHKKYLKVFRKDYLHKLKGSYRMEAVLEMANISRMGKKYPSHLHIDIHPLWQGMGIGTALLERLKEHLMMESANGVFLTCGNKNRKAQAFYERKGFRKIKKSLVMGTSYGMLLRRKHDGTE